MTAIVSSPSSFISFPSFCFMHLDTHQFHVTTHTAFLRHLVGVCFFKTELKESLPLSNAVLPLLNLPEHPKFFSIISFSGLVQGACVSTNKQASVGEAWGHQRDYACALKSSWSGIKISYT